jgi:FdrA protein
VLISVPGRFAADVAAEALDLDMHVFLYSDNVSLADEIKLKQKARQKGLLLMGPDCGTAIVNGIGLGFANRVRRGPIGLVAASGTGLQAVTTSIHNIGGGISQAIGTGGRDLKTEVGGITTLQALDLLKRDAKTEIIVLVSKPFSPDVATTIVNAAQDAGKPVVLNLIGYPPPARQIGNLLFAATLSEAAILAASGQSAVTSNQLEAHRETNTDNWTLDTDNWTLDTGNLRSSNVAGDIPHSASRRPAAGRRIPHSNPSFLRALFSGGTLAYEALLGLQTFLTPIYSNVPLRPDQRLENSMVSKGHTILDLGEDEFTQGRLHPMIDNDLRLRRLQQEAADPSAGFLLLDVVLGDGAHPDPAAELAPAIAAVKSEREIEVMTIVLGTDEDPQDVNSQIEKLSAAGALVVRETSEAVAAISRLLRTPYAYEFPPLSLGDFGDGLAAINVGLESFYDSLKAQGAEAVHVDWRPPAAGDADLMAILARIRGG